MALLAHRIDRASIPAIAKEPLKEIVADLVAAVRRERIVAPLVPGSPRKTREPALVEQAFSNRSTCQKFQMGVVVMLALVQAGCCSVMSPIPRTEQ